MAKDFCNIHIQVVENGYEVSEETVSNYLVPTIKPRTFKWVFESMESMFEWMKENLVNHPEKKE